jgi:uncharacterized protein YfdQ (DUF2303 family)
MEDWVFCITCTDADGNEMDTRSAISAVRRITIDAASQVESELNQLSTTKSSLSKIEASSRGMPLPAWITFTCAPYKCIGNKDIPIRISMNVKREEINFTLKISNFEKIQEDIAEEFAQSVSQSIGTDEKLYLGEFSHSRNISGRDYR